jgi:cytoskeletal protein RodZ
MKKHPVDDLFKNKLSDLQRKPSSAAWDRIETEQGKAGRRLGIWIWYVAAGVAMALITGYGVWINQKGSVKSDIAHIEKSSAKQVVAKNLGEQKAEHLTSESNRQSSDEPESSKQKTYAVTISESSDSFAGNQKPQKEKVDEVKSAQIQAHEEAPQAAEIVFQSVITEPLKEPVATSPVAVSEVRNTNRTMVVNVIPEEDSLMQPKTSRFTRVFRQLKNARAGEKVNWDEVGFNPKAVLARLDGAKQQ